MAQPLVSVRYHLPPKVSFSYIFTLAAARAQRVNNLNCQHIQLGHKQKQTERLDGATFTYFFNYHKQKQRVQKIKTFTIYQVSRCCWPFRIVIVCHR